MNDSAPEGIQRIHKIPVAPPRPADAHKGTFGSALIIAGSEGMSGAACLAGQAALHGGAGLVTVAIPRCIAAIVATVHPSYMTIPLDDESGTLTAFCIPALEQALTKQTAVAVGPGLGQSEDVKQVVQYFYTQCPLPLVLDADGLNAFAGQPQRLSHPADADRILTPHPGEFSRLTGLDVKSIQAARQQVAVNFAKQHNVTLLLKGAGSIITDGRRLAVNTTGGPALATGGTGDVLTGLIVSLLAQGMPAFEATQLAAHLHGLAGEVLANRHSDRYATSRDLLGCLDEAWKRFLEN